MKPALQLVPYDPVGSGAGITGFNGGTYQIAISDDPMSSTQEASAPPKITVPLCVSTFSFFVNGKAGVMLTAAQTYAIYSGATTAWSGVPGAAGKVAGAITPVARNDKSGSTAIVKTLWLTKVEGTHSMCDAVLKTKGAIGYAFTGGCSVVPNKRVVAALKNANGLAVAPPSRNPALAIPTTPPAVPDASLASVDFIWKAGAKTPPMVSMEFAFIKKSLSGATGRISRAFMQFMVGKVSKGAYGFKAVPPAWLNPSVTMVNKIVGA
ncbi:unnamed protein product [Closterium sp. NIES-64]|nr:unnamed protein product [Closterium sp. NIES-64]CAI6007773.1 unnamed protein product [Closterium sp. NIES-65]